MGGHREKLIQRYSAFPNEQRTTGTKALFKLVHASQGHPLRAALHFDGDDPSAPLQDEVNLVRPVSPVVKTDVGCSRC